MKALKIVAIAASVLAVLGFAGYHAYLYSLGLYASAPVYETRFATVAEALGDPINRGAIDSHSLGSLLRTASVQKVHHNQVPGFQLRISTISHVLQESLLGRPPKKRDNSFHGNLLPGVSFQNSLHTSRKVIPTFYFKPSQTRDLRSVAESRTVI